MTDRAKSAAVNVARIIAAATFIVSGFVKAVDPLGTFHKMTDYLEAWQLAQYVPDAVILLAAVTLSALEFTIGMNLLFAIKRRMTVRLLAAVMAVMTPLTLWIAIADPVSDCGCFGDAIKLTNWQTFWKNVALCAATGVLLKAPERMVMLISKTNRWIVFNYTVVFVVALSSYCLYALPILDFRPYHIGADIRKGMEIPPGAPQPKFETTFILEKDGKRKEFALEDYPDSTWTFVDSRTVQTEEGYTPAITDFHISDIATGDDVTHDILDNKGYTFLLVAPHLETADDSSLDRINAVYDYAREHGYDFRCITASNDDAIRRWVDMTGAEYDFYAADETLLQTIVRSNPGLVLLKDATVTNKWSNMTLPDEETELAMPLEKSAAGQIQAKRHSEKIAVILTWFVLPLMLLSVTDRLWAWTRWLKRKSDSNKISN